MIIFPNSHVQGAPKISFYFIFSRAAAVLPLLTPLLPPAHPAHPAGSAPGPGLGFTTALGPPRGHPGKESCQGSGARASFWRPGPGSLGGGRHSKAYLHMLLFHFHTLHANALWKVPSEFPPGRSEGGKRLGRNRRLQPQSVRVSPGATWTSLLRPPGADPGGRPWDPLPARPRRRHLLWPARSAEFGQDAGAQLQPPPRKFWSGARSPGFLSVLSAAPRGNPETFIRCPTTLLAFQVCAG